MLPLNLYARVRFLDAQFAHETAGAARTPSSLPLSCGGPRPLCLGRRLFAKLGQNTCRENVYSHPVVLANARTHTPCVLDMAVGQLTCFPSNARGYRSPRARGRPCEAVRNLNQ